MQKSVKLANEIMNAAREEAELRGRSVADQIAHWIGIGRAIDKSVSFEFQRVSATLEAGLSPDELSPAEQEVWFDQFALKVAVPSKAENAFYAKRRKRGVGDGIPIAGELPPKR